MNDTVQTHQYTPLDWQNLFDRSLLSLFQITVPKRPKARLTYHHALKIEDTTIFILVQDDYIAHQDGYIDEQDTQKAYVKLINQLLKQHGKLLKNVPDETKEQMELADALKSKKYDASNIPPVFFIGITTLVTRFQDEDYYIGYDLDDAFFHEVCIFDLDRESQLMQIFTLQDWQKVLGALQSPSDLLAFLKYHRHALVHRQNFKNAYDLSEQFMHDPVFFQRAWQIEKQLQKFEFMDRVSPRIKQAVYKKQETIDNLHERQQQFSTYWIQMIQGLIERQDAADKPINWWVIRQLILQSSYTRMKIVEPILEYPNQPDEEKQIGFVFHEHSYHNFGQHFAVVIYGLDKNSDLHPSYIYKNYQEILDNINHQLQDKGMKGIFLLGFDLSQKDEENNIQVKMDVFYQPVRQSAVE